jgi:hypothetical protein
VSLLLPAGSQPAAGNSEHATPRPGAGEQVASRRSVAAHANGLKQLFQRQILLPLVTVMRVVAVAGKRFKRRNGARPSAPTSRFGILRAVGVNSWSVDPIRRPSGYAAAEEIGVFGPDRAVQRERRRQDRPIIFVTAADSLPCEGFKRV